MKKARALKLTQADAAKLVSWFGKNARDLPWRRDPKPYVVWLAEIMSQQTRMEVVVPYLARFLERFPSVDDLARAKEAEVLAAWAGLGYYSRARNLHKAARIVVEKGKGFPRTLEALRELPGVGPYTAAAIASQCFGVPEPVWDGNVARVCARLARVKTPAGKAFHQEAMKILRTLMTPKIASAFNQGLMELGATVCMPKVAHCERCPFEEDCSAHAAGRPLAYPEKKKRAKKIEVHARVQLRVRGENVFLVPRHQGEWFSGLWDFESELHGVKTPIRKLYSVTGRKIGQVKHTITNHAIRLEIWLAAGGVSKRRDGRWFTIEELLASRPPVPLATTAKKVLRYQLTYSAAPHRQK